MEVTPADVTLAIGAAQSFSAVAYDVANRPIKGATLSFKADATAGTVTEVGRFQSATKAGAFNEGLTVTASFQGTTRNATVKITVRPDPLDKVALPTQVEVAAGQSSRLEASGVDRHGNVISDARVTVTVKDALVGSVDAQGVLQTSRVARIYPNAIQAEATQGTVTKIAAVGVTVRAGPLSQAGVAPATVSIGISQTQQFVAVGADRYGNRIEGLTVTWSVEARGGTISSNGLFTAQATAGSFVNTVKASVSEQGNAQAATASVTVEPDRIATISSPTEGNNVFIMNADGTSSRKLTNSTGSAIQEFSWFPDGRRIAYDKEVRDSTGALTASSISVVGDDGTFSITLTNSIDNSPAVSPDGGKIAFVSQREGKTFRVGTSTIRASHIYLMDADGNNSKKVSVVDGLDFDPSWSPDGTRLVFASIRPFGSGIISEIFTINADGTNERLITATAGGGKAFPRWSPDGADVIFEWNPNISSATSLRRLYIVPATGGPPRQLTSTEGDGNPWWTPDSRILFRSTRTTTTPEIYIMDRNGSNITRITTNELTDFAPRWAPRKRGITVTSASIVLKTTGTAPTLRTDELVARSRSAVVRIRTTAGTGSGFIFDPTGLVLTNNHVISGFTKVTVRFDDGSEKEGTVVGKDIVRDLAVVKVTGTDFPTLSFGDLSSVQVGSDLIVLGYPLGTETLTTTRGLYSAARVDAGRSTTFLQTDAAVNPGNSGGPIFNTQGQVVGIVTLKISAAGIEGQAFAISINTVLSYLDELKAGKTLFV